MFGKCDCLWLLIQCSSCSVMCCHVSLHSSSGRPRLARLLYLSHNRHTRWNHTPTCTHVDPLWTIAEITCFTGSPERGEEIHMTGSDIFISVRKDTTALKVSVRALCTSQIKSLDLSETHPWMKDFCLSSKWSKWTTLNSKQSLTH